MYGTTDEFLKTFGFESLKDLPDIEGFKIKSAADEEIDEEDEDYIGQIEMNFDSDENNEEGEKIDEN